MIITKHHTYLINKQHNIIRGIRNFSNNVVDSKSSLETINLKNVVQNFKRASNW